jgi:hypothetical protein
MVIGHHINAPQNWSFQLMSRVLLIPQSPWTIYDNFSLPLDVWNALENSEIFLSISLIHCCSQNAFFFHIDLVLNPVFSYTVLLFISVVQVGSQRVIWSIHSRTRKLTHGSLKHIDLKMVIMFASINSWTIAYYTSWIKWETWRSIYGYRMCIGFGNVPEMKKLIN